MFQQLLAITRNTFFESIRQPIMLVVLVAAAVLIVLSNPLSAFTMDENQRMLVDIGLATVFMAGAVLAAFIATNVLGREIENKTALTVISKPVTRPIFLLGKYLGVSCAMSVAAMFMTLVFMLVELHTVIQTVQDPIHVPVIIFGIGGAILGVSAAAWCNYFYNMVFTSSAICITTPILFLAYLLALNFGPDFSNQPMWVAFESQIWLAVVSIMMAILVLCSIAVAVSTRFGQLITLVTTVGLFFMGLLSDWIFGRSIAKLEASWLETARLKGLVEQQEVIRVTEWTSGEIDTGSTIIDVATVPLTDMATTGEHVAFALYWVGYSILPNFQILWLSDALTQEMVIPISYILSTLLYGLFYAMAVLAIGLILFQRREVG